MAKPSETPDVERLRAEAARCRVFAQQVYTQETRKMMLRMAKEFDAEADRLEADARRGPTMTMPPQGL